VLNVLRASKFTTPITFTTITTITIPITVTITVTITQGLRSRSTHITWEA
jgi:hypothetical protein